MYELRKSLTNFFGWLAFLFFGWLAFLFWVVMLICFFTLSYVGVKVQYFLVPSTIILTIIWYLLNPDKGE